MYLKAGIVTGVCIWLRQWLVLEKADYHLFVTSN